MDLRFLNWRLAGDGRCGMLLCSPSMLFQDTFISISIHGTEYTERIEHGT